MSDFKEAMAIVEPFAVRMGWTYHHDPESVDMLVALTNMMQMEDKAELPDDISRAYWVLMYKFGQLFELADGEDDES